MPLFCLIIRPILQRLKNENLGLKINFTNHEGQQFDEFVGCMVYVNDVVLICEKF